MNKYSEWTDEQINREIGQRSGYVVEPGDLATAKMGYTHVLYQKEYEGEPGHWGLVGARSESEAWSYLRFVSDMNAATPLLRECNGSLWFDHVCNLWEVLIEREDDTYIMTNCEQPARAICEAWLLWKDAQQEGAGS